MKTFALCTAGFVAGIGIAAATQTTVLETLGYAPDKDSAVASENVMGSDSESDATMIPSAIADKAPSLPESTTLTNSESSQKKNSSTENKATAKVASQGSGTKNSTAKRSTAKVTTPFRHTESKETKVATKRNVKAGSNTKGAAKIINNSVASKRKQATSAESGDKQRVVVAKPPMNENKAAPAQGSATKTANPTTAMPEGPRGKWLVTKAIHAGQEIPADKLKTMLLEFEDDEIVIQQGSKREVARFESGASQHYGNTTYSQIVITSQRGNTPPIRGYYYHSGEELIMVWAAPGKKLPNPSSVDDLQSARVLTLKQSDESKTK